jgi:type IV pilus assembly protein PilA
VTDKLRNRIESGEQGFTLIELLVVILIIGILAAIAIPSFLNQREKGQDACAKSMARTMQTAMETYYTDNNAYTGATTGALATIENQIPSGAASCGSTAIVRTGANASGTCTGDNPGASNYCVSATSPAGSNTHVFTIYRDTAGAITRGCTPANSGGCTAAGTW